MSCNISYVEITLFCLGLLVLLLYSFLISKRNISKNFNMLVISTFLFVVCDIFWGLCNERYFLKYENSFTICTSVYFVLLNFVAFSWYGYVRTIRCFNKIKYRPMPLLGMLPIVFAIILLIINLRTNIFFGVDENGSYIREKYYWLFYLPAFGYYIASIRYTVHKLIETTDKGEKERYKNLFVFNIVPIFMVFLQFANSKTPYFSMASTISLLGMYLYIEIQERDYYEKIRIEREKRNASAMKAIAYGYSMYEIIEWDTEESLEFSVSETVKEPEIFEYIRDKKYSREIEILCNRYIIENERENFLKQTDINTIRHQLEENRQYQVIFKCVIEKVVSYMQVTFTKIDEDYGKKAFVMVFRNINNAVEKEIKHKEELAEALREAQKANEAKRVFLFNMSHDIRTPMNAVIGFNTLAQKHIDDKERLTDFLKKIELSSRHMFNIINDVLEMTKIESGKMELKEQEINVYDYISECEEMFRTQMAEKGIEFVVDTQIKEKTIIADGIRIVQVVVNLLSNALKFTNPGGRVIFRNVDLGRTGDGHVNFAVHIIDNGIGISKEFQEKMFVAFERERTSTLSGIDGTGLGLSIAQGIANLMGGSLECISNAGMGSEFIFKFQAKTINKQIFAEDDMYENNQSAFSGKRVLIVEDNEINCEILKEMLEEYDFEIETAEDGEIAVDMVSNSEEGHYDIILMDIQMPNMNGYQATEKIRQLENKKLADIPIVAVTANAFEEDKEKAFEVGMNGHIAKPINMSVLLECIKDNLERMS